jgi:hypothetical protein
MNYLQQIAERVRRELPADAMPDDSAELLLMYAVLVRAKGRSTTLEDVHDAWSAWMTLRHEEHESLVPFVDLPSGVGEKDEPFLRAIHAAAQR